MQHDDPFEKLRDKLVRCMKKTDPELKIEKQSIRLWKANPSYSRVERFGDFIKQHDLDHPETLNKLKTQNVQSDPDIEENTGVEFPGY